MRALLLMLAALLAWTPAAAQRFPAFGGLVVDEADVLTPAQEQALTAKLQALQRDTGRQLVVASISDVQGYPLEDYGYRLGRAWGVGLKDVDTGAILFLAPNNPPGRRGPRLEVGRGLEPVLTDAWSGRLMRETMVPRLKAGDVPGALEAGTDAIVAQLRRSPDEAKARTDAAVREFDRSRARQGGDGFPFAIMFWAIVLGAMLFALAVGRRRKGPWGRRYRASNDWSVVLWSVANEIGREASRSRGSGGGWGGFGGGGGGGSSGGWMGGGFTGGGGGSFGGGGATGNW
jgi:uncharacterized protein